VTIGGCGGVEFIGTLTPPLASGGAITTTEASVKTAKAGTVVWGPGFASSVTASGAATCTFGAAGTFGDTAVKAKMAGVASCDSALVDPGLYPLNGKLTFKANLNTVKLNAYARISGFDPGPGPDVITLTGMITKGAIAGASLGGEVYFDPIIKALVNDDPVALALGAAPGQVLKKQYFFDASQIGLACGAGGNAIGTVFGGDGASLLGSVASGMTFDL
jgi:hypothetical protein